MRFGVLVTTIAGAALAFAAVGAGAEERLPVGGEPEARIVYFDGSPVLVRHAEREWLELAADHRLKRYDYLQTAIDERLEFVVPALGEPFARVTLAGDSALYLEYAEQGGGAALPRPPVLQLLRGSVRFEVMAPADEPADVRDDEPRAREAAEIAVGAGAVTVRVQDGDGGVEKLPNGAVLVWANRGWARVIGPAEPDRPAGQQRLAGRGRMVEYRADRGFRNHLAAELGGADGRRDDARRDAAERVVELISNEETEYHRARAEFERMYRELLELRETWYAWMRAERVGRAPLSDDEGVRNEVHALLDELHEPAERLERSLHRLGVLSRYVVQPPSQQTAVAPESHAEASVGVMRAVARDGPILTERLHTLRHLRAVLSEPD